MRQTNPEVKGHTALICYCHWDPSCSSVFNWPYLLGESHVCISKLHLRTHESTDTLNFKDTLWPTHDDKLNADRNKYNGSMNQENGKQHDKPEKKNTIVSEKKYLHFLAYFW